MPKRGEEVGITAYIKLANIAPFHGNNVMDRGDGTPPDSGVRQVATKAKYSSISGTTVCSSLSVRNSLLAYNQ